MFGVWKTRSNLEIASFNVLTFNRKEKYNNEEEWDVKASTTIIEQTRDKKYNSSLKDESTLVIVLLEQLDCEDDWIDDSKEDIVFHEESSGWTPQSEELLGSEEVFENIYSW